MGCAQSDANNPKPPSQTRRRLSLSHVGDGDANGITYDPSGIVVPDSIQVLDLIPEDETSGKRLSLASETDPGKKDFTEKRISLRGDSDEQDVLGLGYTCRKGKKPEAPNQDSWSVLKVENMYSIYAVFDGHGKTGHHVSNFVKDNLPKLIVQDKRFQKQLREQDGEITEMEQMLKDNFRMIQRMLEQQDVAGKISAQRAGTTASVVIHDHAHNKITVSHVADSTVVLGSWGPDRKAVVGKAITRDHKPDLKDERARIERSGGRVVFDGYCNYRVYVKNARYPGLNMSRCLGDLLGHREAGCSCEPEVSTLFLQPEDHVLLVCSDGVWEFIEPQEAVNIVCQQDPDFQFAGDTTPEQQAMKGAETLARVAWDRWIKSEGGSVVDDITVVLVFLNPTSPKDD